MCTHGAGVDVALWAHEHAYERLWPVYNREVSETEQTLYGNMLYIYVMVLYPIIYTLTKAISISMWSQVMNGSYDSPYTNPRAPVHIITGSAVSELHSIVGLFNLVPLSCQHTM